MKAQIYSKPNCTYCDEAKRVLNEHEINYTEYVLGENCTKQELLEIVPQAKTVPQIFIDNKYIGGYNDLIEFINSN